MLHLKLASKCLQTLTLKSPFLLKIVAAAAAAAKSLQSCPTLCDPWDGSPPGSPIPGILQARTLEWVAISFSNAWKWKVKVKSFSHVRLFMTPWTAAYQAAPSMGFSRQEYWSGVPLPSPTQYLLLLLSRFSHVRLCATPETAAHQAPPSLGFSRQEYWSGLPFPSPMHESEKWKWSHSVVSDSERPHRLQLPGSSIHGIFQARVLERGAIAFSDCIHKPLFLTSTQSGLLYRRITKLSLASHTKKKNIPFPAFCGLLS